MLNSILNEDIMKALNPKFAILDLRLGSFPIPTPIKKSRQSTLIDIKAFLTFLDLLISGINIPNSMPTHKKII